ncbi:ribokinase [Candidatus Entotheonella palauensis]|uniref:ribokinase n=1 Tax=Candidatus Entotheonella palauensis TaxID=93172 RepID=UPI0015C410E8|nr:ribokinase [Candidatus Entotheonella palauensis]
MAPSTPDVRPIVIDTDPGVDDALALMLALRSPEVRVDLMTTVAGNVPVDQGTDNACRLLTLLNADPWPPLVRGAAHPLNQSLETATHIHGDDGLGGLTRLVQPDGTPMFPLPDHPPVGQGAAQHLIERAEAEGPALTIVALGPLTNIAQALRQAPDTMRRVGHLIIMGGAVAVPGNVTPTAEFNIYVDPEAAAIVAASGMRMTWVTLDVTRQTRLTQAFLDRHMGGQDTAQVRAIRQLTQSWFQGPPPHPGMPLHDPLAMAVAIDPEVVSCTSLPLQIETRGEHTRGMTVADRREQRHGANNAPMVDIALQVDVDRMLSLFAERVLNPQPKTGPAPKPQARVVVVGGANVDLTVQTPNLPQSGETVQGDTVHTAFGGKGANQALAAKRAGAQVAFVGKMGEDNYGQDLSRFLRQEHIDISGTRKTSEFPSGLAFITVDRHGQNLITVASGANADLKPEDLDGLASLLSLSQVLVTQLENPLATIEAALQQAKTAGLITILNPAPAQTLPARMAPLIDYLIPNEVEATLLSGQIIQTPEQAGQGARQLQQAGYRNVIITLGEQGLVYLHEDAPVHLPGLTVQAVDATAAGDTFVGYFACAIAEGQALADALAFANTAAALSVTQFGAMPSIPKRQDVFQRGQI